MKEKAGEVACPPTGEPAKAYTAPENSGVMLCMKR